MYVKLATDDESLVRQLAQLLQRESAESCTPEQLALLFSVQEAFDWRDASFHVIKNALSDEFQGHPARTLKTIKTSILRMSHRLVDLDQEMSILISNSSHSKCRLPLVGVLALQAQTQSGATSIYQASVLGSSELSAFIAGMQDAATRKISDRVLQAMNDATDVSDLLGDADLPILVHVAQALWKAQRDGDLPAGEYEQVVSKLFRVSGMRILQASTAFAIPGIGPGLAALLFAHRVEQFR